MRFFFRVTNMKTSFVAAAAVMVFLLHSAQAANPKNSDPKEFQIDSERSVFEQSSSDPVLTASLYATIRESVDHVLTDLKQCTCRHVVGVDVVGTPPADSPTLATRATTYAALTRMHTMIAARFTACKCETGHDIVTTLGEAPATAKAAQTVTIGDADDMVQAVHDAFSQATMDCCNEHGVHDDFE